MPMRRLAALALLLPLLAACGALRSRQPDRNYRMAYTPPTPSGTPVPATLRVLPFGIAAAYDRQGFVFRDGPYDIDVDNYNRWIAPPSALITDLIARDLVAAHAFQAVLQAPSALPATYELSGWIETLEEREEGTCLAHVRLRALFVRVPERGARQVLFEDSMTGDEPCMRGDAASVAEATSRAVQHLSDDLRERMIAAASIPAAVP
ncbi:MAG: ABC-type transport auxiliary lipoprotein family protein [bacterium]